MKSHLFLLVVLLGLLQITSPNPLIRFLSQYTTDPERTQTIATACDGKSRTDLFKISQDFDNTAVEKTIKSSFQGFDAPSFIQSLVTGKNTNEQLVETVRTQANGIVVTFIFYILPIVVMLFLLPALCCCCSCPDACPCSDCCRQSPYQPYTKAQYSCPAIFIIIFSTFIIITGIIAFAWRESIQTTYDDVRCSTAIVFDDFLNGNVTRDKKAFFIGIQTLGKELEFMADNIDKLETDLHQIGTNGPKTSQVYSDIDDAIQSSKQIPDGSGNALSLSYPSPLIEQNPSQTVNSNFPSVLGTENDEDTLIYNEIQGLKSANDSLMIVSIAADAFSGALSGFRSGINASAQAVNSLAKSLNEVDKQTVNRTFDLTQTNVINIVVIVFYVIVGILVLFAVITWIASFCMLCFDKSSCRYLLYTGCTCLSLMAFLCFLFSILFAAITPVSYFTCQFISTSLSSKAQFKNNFGPIINNDEVTMYISECLPSSQGEIIETLVGSDIYTSITSLGDTTEELMGFNADSTLKMIDDGYQDVTPTIKKYMRAQILDIDDSSDLQKIADHNQYGSCTAAGFTADSWIPSISQNYVSCNSNGDNATNATCTSTSDFEGRLTGCTGCMDTYLIFAGNTTRSDVLNSLNNRYTGCGATSTSFNSQLANVWENFYYVKEDEIGPVHSRSNSTDELILGVRDSIENDIAGLFDDTLKQLQDNFATLVDPKYGIIAGFNCKVIGEDIQLFFDFFCYDTIVMSFFIQVAFGVIGYLILFIACCAVCLGVRHNRLEQDNQRKATYDIKDKHDNSYGQRPESGQAFY